MLFSFSFVLNAQVILEKSDIAIVGVNANNSCQGESGYDIISVVFFKDFPRNSELYITDNGYNASTGLWRNTEGVVRLRYTGFATIPKGRIIRFKLPTEVGANIISLTNPHTSWVATPIGNPVNLNNGGDQIFFLHTEGIWNQGAGSFNGEILYGFNTKNVWEAPVNPNASQKSNLHPDIVPCNYMNPTNSTDYTMYTGPMSATTQMQWIDRIRNPDNWDPFPNCAAYNAAYNLTSLEIIDFPVTVTASDNSVCPGEDVHLTFLSLIHI